VRSPRNRGGRLDRRADRIGGAAEYDRGEFQAKRGDEFGRMNSSELAPAGVVVAVVVATGKL
jgi:hypothetical protein